MRNHLGQVIYAFKTPNWVKALHFFVLLVVGYALLTNSSRRITLWEAGTFGRFLMVFAIGSLIFLTYGLLRFHCVLTTEMIYLRTWRGTREIYYRDVAELYHFKNGSLYFILNDSSKIEARVPLSKLQEVINAITLAGGTVINGDG